MTELWFRCYCDIYRNRKLRNVTETFQLRYMWFLALHKEGKLVGHAPADIAWELRLTDAEVDETIRVLQDADLLLDDLTPKGWGERQFVSDSSTERVQRHREVKRFSNVPETFQKRPRAEQSRYRADTEQSRESRSFCELVSGRSRTAGHRASDRALAHRGSGRASEIPSRPGPAQVAIGLGPGPGTDGHLAARPDALGCAPARPGLDPEA